MAPRRGIVLLALLLWSTPAAAQEVSRGEEPTPDSVVGLGGALQGAFEEHEERAVGPIAKRLHRLLAPLPPFISETEIDFNARVYSFEHWRADRSRGDALAAGGALVYRSGWIFDAIRVGAALYTSQKLHGPSHRDGTGLLRERNQSYTVAGQAYALMRYGEDHTLQLYRQGVNLPYVNAADTRMTPNTFEAYMIRGKVDEVQALGDINYAVGWIDRIRRRDQDDFIKMSEAAGVPGGDDGMATLTLRTRPQENWYVGVTNHLVPNTFNTFYGEGSWLTTWGSGGEWGVRVDGQLTWQRSVGRELLPGPDFDTTQGALRLALSRWDAIFTVATQATSDEAQIRSPWGFVPAYISLMLSDFDQPGELAFLVGLSYDFKNSGIDGLSAFTNLAIGTDVRDQVPGISTPFGDEKEIDLTIDYRVPEGRFKDLWLRVRGAWRTQDGQPRDDYQLRVILNWDFQIL